MATKKASIETFQIPTPNIKMMRIRVKGTSALIFHKWAEKAIKMIFDKQMKKVAQGREVREPEKEYEDSFYYDAESRVAFPARNLKQAIVGSARFIKDVQMTILRGAIFVMGDKDGFIPVLVKGKPVTRADVKKNKDAWMRQDMVTVGMGSADIRFRGQLEDWSLDFLIQYDADLMSAEQVLNLLQRAGFSQGLGEWRPEKNGDNGTFTVDSTSEKSH